MAAEPLRLTPRQRLLYRQHQIVTAQQIRRALRRPPLPALAAALAATRAELAGGRPCDLMATNATCGTTERSMSESSVFPQ